MAGFDWDEANVNHLAVHGVTPEEIEQALTNNPFDGDETYVVEGEVRHTAFGITDNAQLLTVSYTLRGKLVRPITAWDMSCQERKKYAKFILQNFEEID